ncbi:MAG: HAD family hydrolase [Chloroflexota bacterium]
MRSAGLIAPVSRRAFAGGTAMLAASAVAGHALAGVSAAAGSTPGTPTAADPLPSWNDGPNRRAILAFVAAVTAGGAPAFVPAEDRIAVFDNDGTLWAEQPVYTQSYFAIDEVKRLAPDHPEWAGTEPWDSFLSGDPERIATLSQHEVAGALAAVFTGMTVEEYEDRVAAWFATARHPVLDRPFSGVIYQPQLELFAYLRANGFRTWIVTAGGIDFLRPISGAYYGIPREQVIGSAAEVTWESVDGRPALVRQPKLGVNDDREGKPINIHLFIGRRPILAFGNSDSDQQMLEYAAAGDGPRPSLMLLLDHDDADREFAYRKSKLGNLDTALAEARERDWNVVSMKDDWATVFPA